MKARISNLHKTEAEWSKIPYFIPEAGELIIYDTDEKFSYARIKVGDGIHTLNNLDFFVSSAVESFLENHKYETIIDGGRITGN